jgi:hypothetical protein
MEEDADEHAKSCHLLRVCLEDHKQEMTLGRKITGGVNVSHILLVINNKVELLKC